MLTYTPFLSADISLSQGGMCNLTGLKFVAGDDLYHKRGGGELVYFHYNATYYTELVWQYGFYAEVSGIYSIYRWSMKQLIKVCPTGHHSILEV